MDEDPTGTSKLVVKVPSWKLTYPPFFEDECPFPKGKIRTRSLQGIVKTDL